MNRLGTGSVRVVALAAVLVLAAAACESSTPAASTAGGKTYTVALAVPLNISLFQDEVKGAQAAAKAFGINLKVSYLATYAEPAYISNIESAIATKPDGIIYGWYSGGYAKVTDEALAAGIKIVFVNGTPHNDANFKTAKYLAIGFAGPTEADQSATLAQTFLTSLPGHGLVLLVNNAPGQPDHAIRINTGKAIFEAAGYQTDVLNGAEDTATAVANVSAYLSKHPNVVGAYTTGFNSAQAVCTVSKQDNLTIPVSTFDASPTSLAAIKSGCVTVLVDQQFFAEGFFAVANVYQALRFKTQPVEVNTGTYLVTKDNVDSYPTSFAI